MGAPEWDVGDGAPGGGVCCRGGRARPGAGGLRSGAVPGGGALAGPGGRCMEEGWVPLPGSVCACACVCGRGGGCGGGGAGSCLCLRLSSEGGSRPPRSPRSFSLPPSLSLPPPPLPPRRGRRAPRRCRRHQPPRRPLRQVCSGPRGGREGAREALRGRGCGAGRPPPAAPLGVELRQPQHNVSSTGGGGGRAGGDGEDRRPRFPPQPTALRRGPSGTRGDSALRLRPRCPRGCRCAPAPGGLVRASPPPPRVCSRGFGSTGRRGAPARLLSAPPPSPLGAGPRPPPVPLSPFPPTPPRHVCSALFVPLAHTVGSPGPAVGCLPPRSPIFGWVVQPPWELQVQLRVAGAPGKRPGSGADALHNKGHQDLWPCQGTETQRERGTQLEDPRLWHA
ncbi:collagen alpha-1(I) chain-like [Zonotrichia leucophrys gambelii]|uniref:collagen alpha-1(I) chain-like n=1 Tax=Zonotrichia leucophrys gambelii TaxID=257770 RepID=UPI003140C7C3